MDKMERLNEGLSVTAEAITDLMDEYRRLNPNEPMPSVLVGLLLAQTQTAATTAIAEILLAIKNEAATQAKELLMGLRRLEEAIKHRSI